MATGMDMQFGLKAEVTYGTEIVVDEFVPLISESLLREIDILEAGGIIAGNEIVESTQWGGGNVTVGGSIEGELYTINMRVLFANMFGGVSGAGPYVFVPGDLAGTSFTCQVGKSALDAVHAFTYSGCKVNGWEIALSAGEFATFSCDVVGQLESVGTTALATASYPATIKPFKFTHGTVQYDNVDLLVKQITISGDPALNTDRRVVGSSAILEPITEDRKVFSGAMTVDFADMDIYDDFLAHTEHEIELDLDDGAGNSVVITMNARIDGTTPAVGGRSITEQDIPFTVIKESGGDGIVATVTEV